MKLVVGVVGGYKRKQKGFGVGKFIVAEEIFQEDEERRKRYNERRGEARMNPIEEREEGIRVVGEEGGGGEN